MDGLLLLTDCDNEPTQNFRLVANMNDELDEAESLGEAKRLERLEGSFGGGVSSSSREDRSFLGFLLRN